MKAAKPPLINCFLVQKLGRDVVDDCFPGEPPRHKGQFLGPGPPITLEDFERYGTDCWFNLCNISLFTRNLAWMQCGEYHPCTDLQVENNGAWKQWRLVGQGQPLLHLVSVEWSVYLFWPALQPLLEKGQPRLDEIIRAYDEYTVQPGWELARHLHLLPNARKTPRTRTTREDGRGSKRTDEKENVTDAEFWHSILFPINLMNFYWLTVVAHNKTGTNYLYDFLYARYKKDGLRRPKTCEKRIFHERVLDLIALFLSKDREVRKFPTSHGRRLLLPCRKIRQAVLLSFASWRGGPPS
jgi:hypothetical protein